MQVHRQSLGVSPSFLSSCEPSSVHCADTLSVAGCVLTYVVRVWDSAGSNSTDEAPVDVVVGAGLPRGSTVASTLVALPPESREHGHMRDVLGWQPRV